MAHLANNIPSFTIAEIARALDAEVIGPGDITITSLTTVDEACAGSLTFIRDNAYCKRFVESEAAAAVVPGTVDIDTSSGKTFLLVENTDLGFVAALTMFSSSSDVTTPGVHESSLIDPTAEIHPGATVGRWCGVGPRTVVGDGAVLHDHVILEGDVVVGCGVVLHHNVVIRSHSEIGDRSIIHSGAIIGGDGFGYVPAADGSGLIKIPHLGGVRIGVDVEIGCNSTIDRGKLGDTTIGDGAKIDNLVQIGHNCKIGRSSVLCGQAGISGSVVIGEGVIVGGQAGIGDNIKIGDGAMLSAKTGVHSDIPAGLRVSGSPARDIRSEFRRLSVMKKLPELAQRVRKLEKLAKEARADTSAADEQPSTKEA